MINSYVAIDLETTGLNSKTDKIIEIGAVKVLDGMVTEEISFLIQPGRLLEEKTVSLTGIDSAMLENAPFIGDVIGTIVDFCRDFPLLGHHIIFDYSFLKQAAVNQGLVFEKSGIDTLPLCRKFMPEDERKTLCSACGYFQVKNREAHRALSDAYAAHELFAALASHFGETFPEAFVQKTLIYKAKKEQMATKRQKEGLHELIKYHKIDVTVQTDQLSRNEISRMTDKIILKYGRIIKR